MTQMTMTVLRHLSLPMIMLAEMVTPLIKEDTDIIAVRT